MGLEIGRGQLEGPEFFDVYYHELEFDDPLWEKAISREGVIVILIALKQKLLAAYPDCSPLRRHLDRIDRSVQLIRRCNATIG